MPLQDDRETRYPSYDTQKHTIVHQKTGSLNIHPYYFYPHGLKGPVPVSVVHLFGNTDKEEWGF